MIEQVEEISFSTTASLMAAVSISQVFGVFHAMKHENTKYLLSNVLGCMTCFVAYLHYKWMRDSNNKSVMSLRYSDWYITTPLMILEFLILMNFDMKKNLFITFLLPILTVLMIFFGQISMTHKSHKMMFFIMGMLCITSIFVIFLLEVYMKKNKKHFWPLLFLMIWILYPVAYFTSRYKNTFYNLLDLFSKAIFGLTVTVITLLMSSK